MAAGILATEIIFLFLRIIRPEIQCTARRLPHSLWAVILQWLRSFDKTGPLLFNAQKMQFGRWKEDKERIGKTHKGLVNILKLLYRHFLREKQIQLQIFCEANTEMVAKMCFQKKTPLQNSHPSRQQLFSTCPIILQLLFNSPSHLWAGSKLWSWAALLWDTTCCAISRLQHVIRGACGHPAL